ncbi:MAG: hypothetical protein QOF84_2851 [Streptomyces sp.]|jgi:uncharacterized membrane protein YbhN (UPF0104 family)|nr:hypothetical protein [Streptomyces sp.]
MATAHIPFRRKLPWRQALCLVPLVAVGLWVVWHRALIADGARRLLTADRYWLLVAVAVTGLGWVAVSFARQGAVVERLPPFRLLAAQFAAGTANHLLPSGLGAGAVNLRFLRGCGLTAGRSSAALALYMLAEATGRVALLLALLAGFPHALRLGGLVDGGAGMRVAVTAGLIAVAVALTVLAVRPLRRLVRGFLGTALSDARSVHRRPARALALWGGSLAFPALQAAGLVAVSAALDLPVPMAHVAVAYLVASVLAAAIPAPGGIGSVDAALALALVTAGAPVGAATSAVLGFRIITVWLPLLPGALVLGALVRRKVV